MTILCTVIDMLFVIFFNVHIVLSIVINNDLKLLTITLKHVLHM